MIYTLKLDGGLAPDLDGMDAAENLATAASNMRFESGYAQPFDGHARLYDPPSVTPLAVMPLRTSSAVRWVYLGANAAYSTDNSGTHTNITRAAGGAYAASADAKWTGGAFSGWLIANNPADVPQAWDGNTANKFVDLTGWNAGWRAQVVRPLRNALVALNITKSGTNYPMMVKWSDVAVPGAIPSSWNEADPTKSAGEQDLGDAAGALVDLVPLGDLGVIYSTGAYHSMQFVGGTYIWRFTRLSGDAGAIAPNCVAAYPGGHVVLAAGDVFAHAGGQPRSIATGRVRRALFNALSAANFKRSFVVTNEARAEVWVCVPEGSATAATAAWVWNYAQDTWSKRDLPNANGAGVGPVITGASVSWGSVTGTWDSASGPWDGSSIDASRRRLVLASADGRIYLPDAGTSYDGTSPAAYVERTGLSLGNPDAVKLIKSVRPRIDAPSGTVVNVRVGGAMTADGSYSWSGALPYTVGTSTAAYGFATGRYIGVKVEGTAGQNWRVRSLDIEFENVGSF